jgi:hypothetical protein
MVAVMALMEAIIIVGYFNSNVRQKTRVKTSLGSLIQHSLPTEVYLILGSLIIGMLASDEQALGIKPFTNDLFKGFLAIFL